MVPSGEQVALNAPIVLKLEGLEVGVDVPPLQPSLLLRTTATAEVVSLPESVLGLSPDGEMSFVPGKNLPPNTTFSASFFGGQDDPAIVSNPRALAIRSFTTGTEPAPSLSLEGELSATLEAGEDNALECPNNCGCTATGPAFAVTKARVKLPRPVGGFPSLRATLWLTDTEPATFLGLNDVVPEDDRLVQLGGQLLPEDLEAGEVLWTVPEEELPYKPCFTFQAFDARGDVTETQSLCLEEEVPTVPKSGTPQDTTSGSGARNSSACSFAPATRGAEPWLPALLLLLGGFRRRPKSGHIFAFGPTR